MDPVKDPKNCTIHFRLENFTTLLEAYRVDPNAMLSVRKFKNIVINLRDGPSPDEVAARRFQKECVEAWWANCEAIDLMLRAGEEVGTRSHVIIHQNNSYFSDRSIRVLSHSEADEKGNLLTNGNVQNH